MRIESVFLYQMCTQETTLDPNVCLANFFENETDSDSSFSVPSPYQLDYQTITSPYVNYLEFNNKIDRYLDPIIFMQLNIFSLPSKWDDFKMHLHLLSKNKKVNFIALSETYLTDINCSDFDNLPGYHPLSMCEQHHKDRKGGGVAILIDSHYNFVVREDLSFFSSNIELITAEINPDSKNSFILCSLYRPPGVALSELSLFRDFIISLIAKVKLSKAKACYTLYLGRFKYQLA